MSFQLPHERKTQSVRPRWAGAAFLVEAMLLLVFLTASMAVFTQLFAAAAERANLSQDLSQAVVAGSAVAERFAADPASVPAQSAEGDMLVICDKRAETRAAGTLYHATISVYAAGADGAGVGGGADGAGAAGQPDGSADASAAGSANGASDAGAVASDAVLAGAPAGEPLFVIETASYGKGVS